MKKLILTFAFLTFNVHATSFPTVILGTNESGIFYDYHTQQAVEVTCQPQNSKAYCYCKYTHPGMNTYLYELRRVEANGRENTLEIFGGNEKAVCQNAMISHPACKF